MDKTQGQSKWKSKLKHIRCRRWKWDSWVVTVLVQGDTWKQFQPSDSVIGCTGTCVGRCRRWVQKKKMLKIFMENQNDMRHPSSSAERQNKKAGWLQHFHPRMWFPTILYKTKMNLCKNLFCLLPISSSCFLLEVQVWCERSCRPFLTGHHKSSHAWALCHRKRMSQDPWWLLKLPYQHTTRSQLFLYQQKVDLLLVKAVVLVSLMSN